MENRNYIIDRLTSKRTSIEEFNYDHLTAPPISSMFTPYDIAELNNIARSLKLSGKPQLKYQMIDRIMRRRGFEKFIGGTNRVSYRPIEDNRFLVKIATDAVGLGDNPAEFRNQYLFKPFVTKVFEITSCGTLGIFERVNPITSREEFLSVASDIFEVINEWFVGEYVLADIGTKFFMNWGIRKNFGPVLLDFPYAYKLDGNKLFCSAPDSTSPTGRCEGVIDYDNGFNFLYCTKCGAKYKAQELAQAIESSKIIVKGKDETRMKIRISGGSKNINETIIVGENAGVSVKKTPSRPKTAEKKTEAPRNNYSQQQKPTAPAYNYNTQQSVNMRPEKVPNKPVQSPIEFDESLKKQNQEEVLADCLKKIEDIFASDSMTEAKRNEFVKKINESFSKFHCNCSDLDNVESEPDRNEDPKEMILQNLEKASKYAFIASGMDPKNLDLHNSNDSETYMKLVEKLGVGKNADVFMNLIKDALGTPFLEFLCFVAMKTNVKIFVDGKIDSYNGDKVEIGLRINLKNFADFREHKIYGCNRTISLELNQIANFLGDNGFVVLTEDEYQSTMKNEVDKAVDKAREEFLETVKNTEEKVEASNIQKPEKKYSGFYYFASKVINIKDILPNAQSTKVIVLIDPDDGSFATMDTDENEDLIIALSTINDRDVDELSIVSTKWLNGLLESREEQKEEEVPGYNYDSNEEEVIENSEDITDEEPVDVDTIPEYNNYTEEESSTLTQKIQIPEEIRAGIFPPNVSVNGVSVEEE